MKKYKKAKITEAIFAEVFEFLEKLSEPLGEGEADEKLTQISWDVMKEQAGIDRIPGMTDNFLSHIDDAQSDPSRKICHGESVTDNELDALKDVIDSIIEYGKLKEADLEKKREKDAFKKRKENVLKKAISLGLQEHEIVILIQESRNISESVLSSFEDEVNTLLESRSKKEDAKERIPELLERVEALFAKLPAREQRELSSKMQEYRNAARKMSRPKKLLKNLKWLLKKMSND